MFGADDSIKKRKKPEDVDLDITPMIDVTFLLLIFFMVTSTMQGTPDLDIPPSRHGEGVDTSISSEIQILAARASGGEPSVMIDGREVSLEEVKSFVMEGAQQGKMSAIIMADREVPEGIVMEVEKVIAEVEGVTLHVGVRDKKR
jgi:biopolymer transport protein ExbD